MHWAFTLLALMIGSTRAHADLFTLLSSLEIDGVEYTVAIIAPEDGMSTVSDTERELANQFRTNAETWVGEQYATFYSGSEAEFARSRAFGDIKAKTKTTSSLLMIFRGRNPKALQATLEVASAQELGGGVPSEIEFNRKLGEFPVGPAIYSTISNPWKPEARIDDNLRFCGAKLEIKKFVTLQTAAPDREWAPLLILLGEAGGLTDQAVTQSYRGSALPNGFGLQLYPDRYPIVAMKKMIPYYKRLGFELISEEPLSGELYGLSISRSNYVRKLLPHFERRAKKEGLLSGLKWDHASLFDQLQCPEKLIKTFSASCPSYLYPFRQPSPCRGGMYLHRDSKFRNY